MRYGKERKQVTRSRIIDTAGRRFKQDGIDGSGIATLMQDAGLTNGAFYAHFGSKDELVATVIPNQMERQAATVSVFGPGRVGLEQFVRSYLSVEHRDNTCDGCPSAALLDEIGRCPDATRVAYTDGIVEVVDTIAGHLAPDDPQSARVQVLCVLGLMAGTIQLSRALVDRQLADEVLDQGTRGAITMLAALGTHQPERPGNS